MARHPVRILISGCLIGWRCSFRGETSRFWISGRGAQVLEASVPRGVTFLPVCPEQLGGLPTPRSPSELWGSAAAILAGQGAVLTVAGEDVTAKFLRGAEEVVHLVRSLPVRLAILKDGSPSCGVTRVHAGRFDGTMVAGMGVAAWKLRECGVPLLEEGALADVLDAGGDIIQALLGTKTG